MSSVQQFSTLDWVFLHVLIKIDQPTRGKLCYLNRETQILVPSRNFSHLEPQKFFPINHKKSPIRNKTSAKFSCYTVHVYLPSSGPHRSTGPQHRPTNYFYFICMSPVHRPQVLRSTGPQLHWSIVRGSFQPVQRWRLLENPLFSPQFNGYTWLMVRLLLLLLLLLFQKGWY